MVFNVGDIIETKKPHACGGNKWEIVRTGADIKLKCLTCDRTIFLSIDKTQKSIKTIIKGNN